MTTRVCFWLAWLASTGCAGAPHAGLRDGGLGLHVVEHDMHCARATMGVFGPYRMPLAEPLSAPDDMAVLDVLPPEARRTARAAGLEPLLLRILRGHSAPAGEAEPALQQELTLRLLAFDAQVSALSYEVECTRRRVSDLASQLDAQESDRQFGLAAASLVIGAATGLFVGAWDLSRASSTELPSLVGIGGSLVTAGFGAAMLLVPQRSIALEHRQNILGPVFAGSDLEHLYPSFVFRMLSAKYPNDPNPPRDALLRDFEHSLEEHVRESQREEARKVLFGEGGIYPRELLESRKELLQLLVSAVQGVARDLELLNRFLVRLLAAPPADGPSIETRLREPAPVPLCYGLARAQRNPPNSTPRLPSAITRPGSSRVRELGPPE